MSLVRSDRLDIFKWQDKDGNEVPDGQPLEIPAGFKVPESLADQIKRLIYNPEFQDYVRGEGAETFEESEDFEIDDDMFEPSSPYEEVFDPTLGRGITAAEFRENHAIYKQRYEEALDRAEDALHVSDALRARYKKAREEAARPQPRADKSGSRSAVRDGNGVKEED